MRTVGTIGKFTAALLVFAVGLYAAPKAAAAFKNVQAGTEAPAFKLADLSGNEVSLDSFKGDNAVLVVFWATWSARSLDELRDVQKLIAEFGPKGLKAVAVNVDHEHATDDDVRMIREKAAALHLTYPVLLDKGLDTFRNYGVVAVPSTGVLSRGNLLRDAFNGYPSFVFLELKGQVEELLGLRPREAAVTAKADTSHKPTRAALLNYNLGRRPFPFVMPDKPEPTVRAHLARFGLGAATADLAIANLSGGEKARLLFALMTTAAPQILLLDEPTNHLDVDAREALIQALNDFEGTIVLASHDAHLIEAVVDRLWLVADGTCRPFDGDLDDYRRLVATQRRGRAQDDAKTTDRSESAPSLDRREERRRRAETRVATKPLRESLRAAERRLEDLSKEKAALEAKLADPALYQTAPRDAAQLNIRPRTWPAPPAERRPPARRRRGLENAD